MASVTAVDTNNRDHTMPSIVVCVVAFVFLVGILVCVFLDSQVSSLKDELANKADITEVDRVNEMVRGQQATLDSLRVADNTISAKVATAQALAERAKQAADVAKSVSARLAKSGGSKSETGLSDLRSGLADVSGKVSTLSGNIERVRSSVDARSAYADSIQNTEEARLSALEKALAISASKAESSSRSWPARRPGHNRPASAGNNK